MMGLLKRIFGAPDAARAVFDAARGGIDKAFYTAQEREADEQKRQAAALDAAVALSGQQVRWLQVTESQNLTRRLLAVVAVGCWILLHLVWTALAVVHAFTGEVSWTDAAAIVRESAREMSMEATIIFGFYFGGPVAIKGVRALRGDK